MKTFAAILTASLMCAPTIASAYMCDKLWNAKYGHSCPAGSVYDSTTSSCVITSG